MNERGTIGASNHYTDDELRNSPYAEAVRDAVVVGPDEYRSPGVVSPITTTTKGTTMADECGDCDHPRDRHKGPICGMRDCDCTGYACPHDTAADCDCPRGTASDPAFDPGGALAGPPDARWFCDRANSLVGGDRNRDYGDAVDNFGETGKLWAAVFGHDVTAEQVALCMILLKLQRLTTTIDHTDSWVDIIGYAALGGSVAHIPGRHT